MRSVFVPEGQARNPALRQRIKSPLCVRGDIIDAESQVLEISDGVFAGCDSKKVTFGIPWTMSQFVQRALSLEHPFSAVECPGATAFAVFQCLTNGPAAVAKHRESCLARWEQLAVELKPEEDALCASLHPDVAPFALLKRPLLNLALLKEAEFPATDLVFRFLKEGWPMF